MFTNVNLYSASHILAAKRIQRMARAMLKKRKAARKIKKFMAKSKPKFTKNLLKTFMEVGATARNTENVTFENLMFFLRNRALVSATNSFLHRIYNLCVMLFPLPQDKKLETIKVRVFLTIYMVCFHPANVFENRGATETTLINSSTILLEKFKAIYNGLNEGKTLQDIDEAKSFAEALFDYFRDFEAWKVPDMLKLTTRVKSALVGLHRNKNALPVPQPLDSTLLQDIEQNIERLESKLVSMAGKDALEEFNKQLPDLLAEAPAPVTHTMAGAVTTRADHRNEQYAHELLLDPNFKLDSNARCEFINPIHMDMDETLSESGWEVLIKELTFEKPCYVKLFKTLENMDIVLTELSVANQVDKPPHLFNVPKMQAQISLDKFGPAEWRKSFDDVVKHITSLPMSQSKAETKDTWRQLSAKFDSTPNNEFSKLLVEVLRFMSKITTILRVDTVNKRLKQISSVIKEHGIGYEKEKFAAKLLNGTIKLDLTTIWIKKVVNITAEKNMKQVVSVSKREPVAFVEMHKKAMMHLIFQDDEVADANCPETLALDVYRLYKLQQQYRNIVFASTVLATVVEAGCKRIDNVSAILAELPFDKREVEALPTELWELVRDVEKIKSLIQTNVEGRILDGRVQHVLLTEPLETDTKDKYRCIIPFMKHIKTLRGYMETLIRVNWAVHGERYWTLISTAAAVHCK